MYSVQFTVHTGLSPIVWWQWWYIHLVSFCPLSLIVLNVFLDDNILFWRCLKSWLLIFSTKHVNKKRGWTNIWKFSSKQLSTGAVLNWTMILKCYPLVYLLKASSGFHPNQTVDLVSLAYRNIGDTSALQSKLQDGCWRPGLTTPHMALDRHSNHASFISITPTWQ